MPQLLLSLHSTAELLGAAPSHVSRPSTVWPAAAALRLHSTQPRYTPSWSLAQVSPRAGALTLAQGKGYSAKVSYVPAQGSSVEQRQVQARLPEIWGCQRSLMATWGVVTTFSLVLAFLPAC